MTVGTHIDLGGAMITMVEPTRDPEKLREYNRWYEQDHCYSGVMVGPGAFSFGRFVATRALKDLRIAPEPSVADPIDTGTYIAFYWYVAGSIDEHFAWSFAEMPKLTETGRMNGDRAHVSTSLYDFEGSVNREGWPVTATIALDHRYPGLVVAWLDRAGDATSEQIETWLRDEHLPTMLAGSRIAQALVFAPRDFPGIPGTGVGIGDKVLVAFFLQADPREVWDERFTGFGDAVAKSGLATLGLLAPFVPVVLGTDTFENELW
jgi:hypothetical protein